MKRLWAPWRMEYIQGEREEGCIFCNAIADPDEMAKLVIHKGRRSIVMMNKFPYIGGHLLVAPSRHIGELEDLDNAERLDMLNMTICSVAALRKAMHPQGFNIGINMGTVAGAGIPDHIHIHIVPRWNGDTNFVPVLGEARIINEHLIRTWEKLRDKWTTEKE